MTRPKRLQRHSRPWAYSCRFVWVVKMSTCQRWGFTLLVKLTHSDCCPMRMKNESDYFAMVRQRPGHDVSKRSRTADDSEMLLGAKSIGEFVLKLDGKVKTAWLVLAQVNQARNT